ncbi:low specificity L-threonine aldolase [Mycoavidus sp. B2-EB]|uniref:threonine aldolase family protein n=1 Tax=Mycoavidus sp. B2-EB TaxID=2651972 RepID=UPI001E4A5189|nr:GntG family PLP-dependent aldolase [Mycoavidus sp. B2-EB]
MAQAPVGDDAYGEDESVNRLQDACKHLFRVEDALFVTSGMMANRLAFMSQTVPGNEVITESSYHVNFFDSAPMAAIAGVVMNPCRTQDGILRSADIESALDSKQRYAYFAQPKLVSIENTINSWAGKLFPFETLKNVYSLTQQRGLRLHLDGARLFNAHIATGIALHDYARYTNTLSVCFSKSLGAPYGSMLMGSKETIDKARHYRLWLGGGAHQIGMQAAGAHYALQHNLKRLAEDHQLARYFAKRLLVVPGIKLNDEVVETNMVQFTLDRKVEDANAFLQGCAAQGVLLFPWLPGVIRAVIHSPITLQQLDQAVSVIQENLKIALINR